jgi:hypothetical protein
MIKSNSQYLRLDPLPKEKDLSFLNALSNKNHVQCPGVDQLDRAILSRSLPTGFGSSQFCHCNYSNMNLAFSQQSDRDPMPDI